MRDLALTDARLRELYQQAIAGRAVRERDRCVAPEALRALLQREGPEEQRLQVLDHAMACEPCRGELELLRAIEHAGARSERENVVWLRPRRTWRYVGSLALAASVLLAVGVGVRQRLMHSEGPDVVRGAADAVALLAPPSEVVGGAPITFAWRPIPGARRYELEVLNGDGKVVLAETTERPSVTVSDPRRLVPGSEYRWWVRATTGADAQWVSSLRSLRIRRQ